jgi:hypothetical protein
MLHYEFQKQAKSAARPSRIDSDYCGLLRESIAGRARGKGTLATRAGTARASPGSHTSHSQMR